MDIRKGWTVFSVSAIAFATALGVALSRPAAGSAQTKSDPPPDHSKHVQHATGPAAGKDLPQQFAELRDKVARLEAALAKTTPKPATGMGGMGMGPGMGGMMGMDQMMGSMGRGGSGKGGQGMGGMGIMDMMMGGMGGGQSMPGMGMMGDDMDMMGMMGMGSMGGGAKGMGKMKMAAALPGFPGASHIYHIGATGFFLDHPEHITLSTQQQTKLNRVKQKALTDKASAQRRIEQAEQELWELTASDEPDAAKIEAQVRAIERLRGDQRLAFIRAVGDAAKVLSDEQRKALLGVTSDKGDQAPPHTGH
jgi:hypothetical protein